MKFTNIILGRCPRCARARVLHGLGRVDTTCPACGLNLKRIEKADGPAVLLIFILGFLITPPALYVGMHTEWPLWAYALLWGGVVMLGIGALMMPSKSIIMHMQYRMRPHDFEV